MKSRIGYIDGLRAIAVLSVIVHHAAKYNQNLLPGVLQHTLLEGAHGVDLFFVISGFCLSYPTLVVLRNEGRASFDVARYFAHRFIRILPPYYLAIGFCWLLLAVMTHYGWHMPWGIVGPSITPVEVLKQMAFLDQRPQLLNGSFWSLAVEFRWYFLFPLLLALWIKSPRAFALVAVGCFGAAQLTRAAGLDIAILPAFMLGIVAADVEVLRLPLRRLAPLLCILALCVALALEPKDQPWEFYGRVQVGWQLTAFFFVVAAGCLPWLTRLLSVGLLTGIGLASYSMYLVHEPLIGLIEGNFRVGAIAAGAIAGAAGILFWAVCERPFVQTRLKPWLVDRLRAPLGKVIAFVGVSDRISLHWPQWKPTAVHAHEPVKPTPEPQLQSAPL